MEHPACYLAQRIRARHHLSDHATVEELLRVCHARGAAVAHAPRLRSRGLYLPEQGVILLRDREATVIAHELLHFLWWDNAGFGVWYGAPEFATRGLEYEAAEFARLLCGEEACGS